MKISKYSVLANIYFFFNSLFLPKGLLYTTILGPIFFYRTVRSQRKTFLKPFSAFLIIYDAIHLYIGVDIKSFFVSNVLFILTYFCVISFYHFVNNYDKLPKLFKEVLLCNALLALLAIPFFFAPKEYQQWFWYINKLTVGFEGFPRLALFTYEASYYSLLLIPVWYYYVFKFLFNSISTHKWLNLFLITTPMIMSLSFGVIGASLLTLILMCVIFSKRLYKFKRPFLIITSFLIIISMGLFILWYVNPDNAFFARLQNIIEGKDTSTNGRTTDSFTMAWRIAYIKNIFFGAGLGQIKIMAAEVVHKYYNYWGVFPRYDIPNAMGETLAIFGLLGVFLRLVLEMWLFFKTHVFSNYYRLALFIFVFIYQFTGSFITNIVEYVIWILAFSNAFTQFNKNKKV
ncbi:O-antigen ligase family protein [Aurantibacillus circumpalustris]|uniref:O-antigen ligase family protein n=1 Tax=Aurantibacillus circumpalustris TaxID=3036359 RepID=UPI00295AEA73|nr:O-antigen ligase family protein [Aurantibacillus circumpalustris]